MPKPTPAPKDKRTAPRWRDSLGQWFEPGDFLAVATISGRSPQLVIAQVVKINTHDAKGFRFVQRYNGPAEADTYGWYEDDKATVTVTCTPIHDGRNFHRSKGKWMRDPVLGWVHDGTSTVRDSTYRIVGNLVKLNEDQVVELLIKQEKDAEKKELDLIEEALTGLDS